MDRSEAEKFVNDLPVITDTMKNDKHKPITAEEVSQVICSLSNNKSPGTDGLTYEFYKLTNETITPVLVKVFNKVLEGGSMPISWHKSLITLIPKKERIYFL